MYLDVDNFKRVNDRFGHAAGDEALVAIANTLRGAVRATDVLARLGGDEFAVLMWQVDESEVATLAQRIVDRVSRLATDYPGSELGMTAGAAYFSVPPANAAHAIRVADETMYQGKRGGKGRVCVAIHPPDHEAPPTSDDRRDSREIAI
jgi:diguanylate cyclase (GGDEF)-like protein